MQSFSVFFNIYDLWLQGFAVAVLYLWSPTCNISLYALFQSKKRKLGLLEDDDISKFGDLASAKEQKFEERSSNDDFGGTAKNRGMLILDWEVGTRYLWEVLEMIYRFHSHICFAFF